MIKLSDKLNEFEDFELAFLLSYKGDEYTPTTKGLILEEIKRRNLNETDLINLIREKENHSSEDADYNHCPRCSSNKIVVRRHFDNSEIEGDNAFFGLEPKYVNSYECGVCGYNFQSAKNIEIRKRWSKGIFVVLILFLISLIIKVVIYSLD